MPHKVPARRLHRGLTDRVLRGDKSAEGQRLDARTALKAAVTRLDATLAQSMDHQLGDAWPALRAQLLAPASVR